MVLALHSLENFKQLLSWKKTIKYYEVEPAELLLFSLIKYIISEVTRGYDEHD
jgi:hypothetical protein